jgi:DnaJ-class molecular chaperone
VKTKDKGRRVCPDCDGECEAPRSLLGACLICPTCGGHGELNADGSMVAPPIPDRPPGWWLDGY